MIQDVLPEQPPGLTRKEIWERLPDEWRKYQVRFQSVMAAGVGTRWLKMGSQGKGGFTYWRNE